MVVELWSKHKMRINGVWCVHKYDDKRQKVSYSVLRCVLLEKTREIFHIILHIVIHVETWNTFTKNYVRVCLYVIWLFCVDDENEAIFSSFILG